MIGAVTKRATVEITKVLRSIYIDTEPATTSYTEGENLDLTGLVVKAVFNTGEETITGYDSSPQDGYALTTSDNTVTISYTFGGVTATASFSIEVVAATVTLTLSGTGNANYCYVSIGGTKYKSAQTITVNKGTTVTFGVYGYSSTYYGEVKVGSAQVLKVTDRTTKTYNWTANSNAAISMTYTSSSSRRNGRISVTTS